MSTHRTQSTKMSRGKVTTKPDPGGSAKGAGRAARAHRDDTTEAKMQRERVPKTHPRRAPVSARKD